MEARSGDLEFVRPLLGQASMARERRETTSGVPAPRVHYLDGVRGLASMQVVFQHYTLAFAPAHLSQWGILADGNFAVFVFFLISGFVLTPSFERHPYAIATTLGRRAVRLGLPVAAACAFAALLRLAWPDAMRQAAATLSNSHWLAGIEPVTFGRAVADIAGLSLMTGYGETTLFWPLTWMLPSWTAAIDPPVWSLHIEIWGSVLVLALVSLRARSRWLEAISLAACFAAIGVNALNLFVLGSLLSIAARGDWFRALLRHRLRPLLGCAIFLLGVAIEYGWPLPLPGWLWRLDPGWGVVHPYGWFFFRVECAAIALFVALLILPELHPLLCGRLAQWLGKLSFAIYLLHFPIMMTLGATVFVYAAGRVGIGAGASLALVAGVAATLPLAVLFERLVDRPAIAWSRSLMAREIATSADGLSRESGGAR